MTRPLVPCRACRGTGKTPLVPSLQAALDAASRPDGVTAPELYAMICRRDALPAASPTAANNQLEELRELGFVLRERKRGRAWVYEPAERVRARRDVERESAAESVAHDLADGFRRRGQYASARGSR